MSNKQIKAYATKQPDSDTYTILHTGIGRDCWIPVFESDDGQRKLREHYKAFSQTLENGLEFMVVDVKPLVSAHLLDENKLHNFH